MEIQNISGSDIITNGFSSNINIKNENTEQTESQKISVKNEPDENENKGRNIDKTI